jgi:thiosulfate/3-mercaptopyruvate sulfurtransferase
MRSTLIALCFLVAGSALAASRDSLIVDSKWLAAHLNDPDLVLLHVGDKNEYPAKHIPGARFVSLADISISDHSGKGLMLEMPPADDLRARLENLGISDKSRVIVYYGKDWVSPTTRVLFTLDYAGLGERSSLLDGGMEAWIRAGQKTTDVVPEAKKGSLAPLKLRPLIVDAATVKSQLGKSGVSVIDGRSASFYDGADTGGSHDQTHKTGHIAGAKSVPFTEVVNDENVWKSPQELEALFTKAGVKPGDAIIGYCHIGQQATAMLFAARTLGHKVQLYDGSFEDWSLFHPGPVENPASK